MLPPKIKESKKNNFLVYVPMSSVSKIAAALYIFLSLLNISNTLSFPLVVMLKHMSRRRQRKTRVEKEASQGQLQNKKGGMREEEDPRLTCLCLFLDFFFLCHSSIACFLLLSNIPMVFSHILILFLCSAKDQNNKAAHSMGKKCENETGKMY